MGNVKVGVKLFTSVCVTALLTLVVGTIGYQGLVGLGAALSRVTGDALPCVAGLGMVKEGLLAAQSAERTILVPELANSKEFERQRENLRAGLALADAGREIVDRMPLDEEETAQWKAFNEALAAWRKTNAQVLELVAAGKRSNALTLSIGMSQLSQKKALDALNFLQERRRGQADALAVSSLEDVHRRTMFLTAAAAACLLLSAALGIVITLSITRPLGKGVAFAKAVADGDLEARLDVAGRDEIAELAASMRRMLAALRDNIAAATARGEEAASEASKACRAMEEADGLRLAAECARRDGMQHAAERLSEVAGTLSSAAVALSDHVDRATRGAREQSSRLSEAAASMGEMSATVLDVAQSAATADATAASARDKASAGSDVVRRAMAGIGSARDKAQALARDMDALGGQAEGIGRVLGVISDIADQTNLLALNAAIEAARAGEAGRGFAVVADEVRKLAEKTMAATAEVGQAVRGIQAGARQSVSGVGEAVAAIESANQLAGESGQALAAIVGLVETASDQVRSIAAASQQQSAASDSIEAAVAAVGTVSMDTADAMEQAAGALADLSQQARIIEALIEELRGEATLTALPS
jgi:methyl-accepting chemotaxis protein